MSGLDMLNVVRVFKLYLRNVKREPDGSYQAYHAMEVMMQPIDEGASGPPMLRLVESQGQSLMDQLWECGLRPSQGSGSAGSLAATTRHLEDMRRLVFSTPPGEIGVDRRGLK